MVMPLGKTCLIMSSSEFSTKAIAAIGEEPVFRAAKGHAVIGLRVTNAQGPPDLPQARQTDHPVVQIRLVRRIRVQILLVRGICAPGHSVGRFIS